MATRCRPPKEGTSFVTPLTVRVSQAQLDILDHFIDKSEDTTSRPDVIRRFIDFIGATHGLLPLDTYREDLFSKDEVVEGVKTKPQRIDQLEVLLTRDRLRRPGHTPRNDEEH